MEKSLSDKITVLVNSCDSYSDLWNPFFTLLNRYLPQKDFHILLNTENKDYCFAGLNIECVHPKDSSCQYGQRMIEALDHVRTKYVMVLLDDFFIRKPLDIKKLENIVKWMDEDKHIVSFLQNPIHPYYEYNNNKCDGFMRVPPGRSYTLNLQAGLWRLDKFKKTWRPNINPWEYELYTNIKTYKPSFDVNYRPKSQSDNFVDYGYSPGIWGIYRGKIVKDDVVPLFEKEHIEYDYSIRGFYMPCSKKTANIKSGYRQYIDTCYRAIGPFHTIQYVLLSLLYFPYSKIKYKKFSVMSLLDYAYIKKTIFQKWFLLYRKIVDRLSKEGQ